MITIHFIFSTYFLFSNILFTFFTLGIIKKKLYLLRNTGIDEHHIKRTGIEPMSISFSKVSTYVNRNSGISQSLFPSISNNFCNYRQNCQNIYTTITRSVIIYHLPVIQKRSFSRVPRAVKKNTCEMWIVKINVFFSRKKITSEKSSMYQCT